MAVTLVPGASMKIRALRTLAIAFVFLAAAARAEVQIDARVPKIVLAAGSGEITSIPLADETDARVIVEFVSSGNGAGLAARQQTLTRFRSDLASLAVVAQSDGPSSPPSITREFTRGFFGAAVSLAGNLLPEIEALPYVRRVHRDVRARAAAIEAGVAAVGAPEVWTALGAKGAGIRVAIIDTGIDYRHPALGGGLGPQFKVVGGYDFVNDDADPMDDAGHGTHVAGTVAANSPDLLGVAPEASLLAWKALDASGFGDASDIIAAIDRSLDPNGDGDRSDRAHVINLSLSAPGGPEDALSRAVDAAVAAGVVVCVAAGNTGEVLGVQSPGTAESAITVGAAADVAAVASFSARGPNAVSYTIKPDLIAPGVAIRSSAPGGGVKLDQGTSMASPHVAGAAALLLQLHPGWTPALVKSALVSTARHVTGSVMETGSGHLDALRAASATTFVAPSSLSFGVTDGSAPLFTSARSLAIANHSSATQELAITAPNLPPSVTLVATPANITLPPGASVAVEVVLTVDNALVGFDSTFARGGVLEVRSATATHVVPWAFVKGLRLRMTWEGTTHFASVRGDVPVIIPMVSDGTFETLVAPGAYDLTMIGDSKSGRGPSIVAREAQAIAADRTFAFTEADAPYRLTFTGTDETSTPVVPEAGRKCFGHRSLALPKPATIGRVFLFGDRSQTTLYSSALSDRYALHGADLCRDDDLQRVHVLHYPSKRGISGDTAWSAGGAALREQRVALHFPAGGGGELILAASGFTPEMRMDFTATFPWPGDVWNGRIFFEPSDDPDARTSPLIAAQRLAVGRMAGTAPDPLRIRGDRVGSYWTPAPTPVTYLWPLGDPIAFGDGFALPLVFYRSSSPSDLAVDVGFAGPVGETRTPVAQPAITSMDDAGNAVEQRGDAIEIADPARLRRLEIVSEGAYRLEGARGTASLNARFGADQGDRVPPSVTSLRILRGDGKVAARFTRGAPARLMVSAIDYAPMNVPARIREGSLALSYRRIGTLEWTPLTVTSQGEDFDVAIAEQRPPYGAIASADLIEATRAHGYYELKIEVEDARGNATETILSPAFVVSAPPRARTVRR